MDASTFSRRALLASFLAIPTIAAIAREPQPSRLWLLGQWLSDRERTIQSWYFQGREIPQDKKARFAELFGHMTYVVTASTFRVKQGEFTASHRYSVLSETESSVTLRLHGTTEAIASTFYRAGPDALFIKVGTNLEYFKRVAA